MKSKRQIKTEELLKQYFTMLAKLAWSFHYTTGLPFDDLLSSAYLALCHCQKSYNPEKSKFTTYLYHTAKTRIIDYCLSSYQTKDGKRWYEEKTTPFLYEAAMTLSPYADYQDPETLSIFKESLCNMSKEAQQICEEIFNSPLEFIEQGKPKLSRGHVYRKLRDKGWSWSKIWNSFREIKTTLNEIG